MRLNPHKEIFVRVCRQCGDESADSDGFCSDSCEKQYDKEYTGEDEEDE